MRRLGLAPKITDLIRQTPFLNTWFSIVTDRFNVYQGTADPTIDEVPESQWIIYTNTSLSETRIWANIGGTLVKSAAFT